MAARTASLWETIAAEAERESPLWAAALRPAGEREELAVFSPLADGRFAVGLESIYEGYLLHYGRPRLFAPADRDTSILLGDYLYAHGLVRIASLGDVDAVGALAELLSLCAHLRAERAPGDGEAWATTVSSLDGGADGSGEDDRERALALHAERVE
ncbi:MAG: hypothetical protein ABI649_01325 [Gaiellaceae bacterium]